MKQLVHNLGRWPENKDCPLIDVEQLRQASARMTKRAQVQYAKQRKPK